MPLAQSNKAKLFEGHPVNEGWESTTHTCYAITAIMLLTLATTTPTTDIDEWARQEVLARMKVEALKGVDAVKFGKHYQDEVTSLSMSDQWDKFTAKSTRVGDEEDEDEEDDD